MKTVVAAAALLLTAPHAHAQWVVIDTTLNKTALATFAKDAATELHTAQDVINTGQTVVNTLGVLNSVAHGNVMDLARLAPIFGTDLFSNPLGSNTSGIADLMSGAQEVGGMGAQVMDLFGQAKSMTTVYAPTGNDFTAQAMLQKARATAGQLAIGTQYTNSSANRLAAMPALRARSEAAVDLKSSVDAGNTIAVQQATQTAQGNQLLALQLYQHAEEAAQRGRDEQEWRRGSDALVTQAQAASAAAASGRVALITP